MNPIANLLSRTDVRVGSKTKLQNKPEQCSPQTSSIQAFPVLWGESVSGPRIFIMVEKEEEGSPAVSWVG
jgi:hypothetical protein